MLIGALLLLLGLGGIVGVGYIVLSDRSQTLTDLNRRIGVHNEPAAPVVRVARPGRALTIPNRFAPLLAQAQIEVTPQMISILIGVLAISFSLAFAVGGVIVALISSAIIIALPIVYVRGLARRRTNALTDALPFYVDGVRQLMSVGNSLPQALMRAMSTAAEPIQVVLGPAARRIELGAPVGESLQQLADRVAIPELAMLAAAVRSNLRFGGSMATILGNLSQIMRERTRIHRELSAATAEVGLSSKILTAIPIILIVILFSTNEEYRRFFFHDPRGHKIAIFAAGLQIIGTVVMMRLKRLPF